MTGFLIKTLRNEEFGFYLKAWCKFLKLDFTVLHLLCEWRIQKSSFKGPVYFCGCCRTSLVNGKLGKSSMSRKTSEKFWKKKIHLKQHALSGEGTVLKFCYMENQKYRNFFSDVKKKILFLYMLTLLKFKAIVANYFVTCYYFLLLPNLPCFTCHSCMLAWLSAAWAFSILCYWFCL